MNAELELLGNRWLGALLTGGYQGLALIALVWLIVKVLPRINAATRHAVWFGTMLAVAALPVIHFLKREINPGARREESAPGPAAEVMKEAQADFLRADEDGSMDESKTRKKANDIIFNDDEFLQVNELLTTIADLTPHEAQEISSQGQMKPFKDDTTVLSLDSVEFSPSPMIPAATVTSALPEQKSFGAPFGILASWFPAMKNWELVAPGYLGLIVLAICASVGGLRLFLLVRECFLLSRIKGNALPPSTEIAAKFQALKDETSVSRKVSLGIQSDLAAPIFAGLFRPAVLLPEGLLEEASPESIEQVLRHELGHAARLDDWANLIQQGINSILFFQPGISWLSRRISIEREIACDDHVLAATGSPRAYALFLTEFASHGKGRDFAAAPAAWRSQSQLKERIDMILDAKRNSSPRLARTSAGALMSMAALIAVLGLNAAPRLIFAAGSDEAPPAPPAPAEPANAAASAPLPVPPAAPVPPSPVPPIDPSGDVVISGSQGATLTAPRPKPDPHPAPHPVASISANVRVLPPILASADVHAHPHVKGPVKVRVRGDEMEKRLERLERMVESLLAEKKGKKSAENRDFDVQFDSKFQNDFSPEKLEKMFHDENLEKWLDPAKLEKIHKDAMRMAEKAVKDHGANEKMQAEMEKVVMQAMRHANRAMEDAQRSIQEAQQVAKERDGKGEKGRDRESRRREVDMRKKTLDQQRQALEKEMQKLEEKIEQLEEQHDQLENQQEQEEEKEREKKEKEKHKNNNNDNDNSNDNSNNNDNNDDQKPPQSSNDESKPRIKGPPRP